jgi:hypothetical protein
MSVARSALRGLAMKNRVQECRLVVRKLKHGAELTETDVEVASLDELFDNCLSLAERHLLERIVITGSDEDGRKLTLAFSFQSVARRD